MPLNKETKPNQTSKWWNCSIWQIKGPSTIPFQSGPGNNDNEEQLHITQCFRTGASPSDCSMSFILKIDRNVYTKGQDVYLNFLIKTQKWNRSIEQKSM